MSYATEHIANTLKAARKSKGLSQRELSAKSGVPQGHISKIENGTVDLRISSLVALGRALDLELMLVPRKTIPAVRSVVRSSAHGTLLHVEGIRQFRKEMERLEKTIDDLPRDGQSKTELAHFQRQVQLCFH